MVLAWPHKDCVLEGGQTKEDQKRNEIFWNETLAPDEIDRLLDPKVFTNWKKYDQHGEHPVTEFTDTDNLIIKGNNLLALASLKKRYAGKVKLIYIDPPYNTESDEFRYNDTFNHSTWLTFIKNRLVVAKELMKSNGIIFIHIGDQELHYLKILCDEIFGREYFIATIPRKTRNGKSDVPFKMSQDYDWMLVYTKKAPKTDKLFQRSITRKYYKSDDFPDDEWRLSDLTTQRTIDERPNSDFTLINPKNGDEYPVNPNRCWSVTKDSVLDFLSKGKIVFPGDYDFLKIEQPAMRVFKSEEIEKNGDDFDKAYVSTDFLNKMMDDLLKNAPNKKGTDEMVDLFGEKIFSYPKNELLLQRIIEYSTNEGDVILDFFMGSATTQAVAHKMKRRYIGIEQMDYINTVSVERLKKVIGQKVPIGANEVYQHELEFASDSPSEYCKLEFDKGGISKAVNWQGGGSFIYCELAKYNQTFADRILAATSKEELLAIWEQMKEKAFLSYQFDKQTFDERIAAYKTLPLDDQKKFLLEILDKNQLYVNYSEMKDETYGISQEDQKLNDLFYGKTF
ncbi:site-specific DNA-methyltransferase [Gaoshiqia sediminis]|uniref:site-specific DNA-methyltransferase (adenine-specific) n=1 Tax=Gaoshiqia sediminis TaxID=2986998 RepID=A0AA41Y5Q0_9BACT|nr:site-specific DNA-methyltransferase [Gaoshiqia sediminis]MCW0482409.1 site-specific DNA-methyltransferase [Gaoshiqia sediminis]